MLTRTTIWAQHYKKAANKYRKAISLNPNFADAHCNLGNALWSLRKLEEAAASYRMALDIHPWMTEAAGSLGSVLLAMGKTNEGLALERDGFGVINFDARKGVVYNFGKST